MTLIVGFIYVLTQMRKDFAKNTKRNFYPCTPLTHFLCVDFSPQTTKTTNHQPQTPVCSSARSKTKGVLSAVPSLPS